MRKAGSGLIINTSSLVGRITGPFFGTYAATKHALEPYSQGLRYEVSPFGVDVVLVEPGPFGTGLLTSGQAPVITKSIFLLSYKRYISHLSLQVLYYTFLQYTQMLLDDKKTHESDHFCSTNS